MSDALTGGIPSDAPEAAPTPMTTAPAPAAAPAAPAPGLWKRVLSGALTGLAHGGIPGAIISGATDADPAMYQRQQEAIQQARQAKQNALAEQQSTVKFQSAQAAHLAADTMMQQRRIDQASEELKLKQADGGLAMANYMTNQYGPPSQITKYDPKDDTDAAAHASLDHAQATNGGAVPPMITVHAGDNLLHWNGNDMANSATLLSSTNKALHLLGQQLLAPGDFNRLKPEEKLQKYNAVMALIQPDTMMDPGKVNSAKIGAEQALANAPKDADPEMLDLLKKRVKFLGDTHSANQADAVQLAGQKAGASQAATEPTKQSDLGKTEMSKIWTDPAKGYAAALAQGNQTKASIKAGADGNGLLTSMAPTMEVLGVNHAAGINRISPAEMTAAGLPGSFAERWNAWATKAISGQLSPQLASEGQQLMGIVLDAAHAKAVMSSKFIAKNRGIKAEDAPALDSQGNMTTLDKAENGPRVGEVAVRKHGVVTGYSSDGKTVTRRIK